MWLLNSVQYALNPVQYADNIARLLKCKMNGGLFKVYDNYTFKERKK